MYCSSGQNRQLIIYVNLLNLYDLSGVLTLIKVFVVLQFFLSLFPKIFCLDSCKGKKIKKIKWLNCRILENLILLKMSCLLNWLYSSLISLFGICFIMSLIFSLRIESTIKQCCYAWLMNIACLLILLLILCFFNS